MHRTEAPLIALATVLAAIVAGSLLASAAGATPVPDGASLARLRALRSGSMRVLRAGSDSLLTCERLAWDSAGVSLVRPTHAVALIQIGVPGTPAYVRRLTWAEVDAVQTRDRGGSSGPVIGATVGAAAIGALMLLASAQSSEMPDFPLLWVVGGAAAGGVVGFAADAAPARWRTVWP